MKSNLLSQNFHLARGIQIDVVKLPGSDQGERSVKCRGRWHGT